MKTKSGKYVAFHTELHSLLHFTHPWQIDLKSWR